MKQYDLAKLFLLFMSWWFYAYFNFSYFFLIFFSILCNYGVSFLLNRLKKRILRTTAFLSALVLNLGVLFYYKYFDFFISNVNKLFHADFALIHVLLPLGISFFSFQQISFIIDCYRGDMPVYSFLDYALFVSFFPQLVAGPIVLHHEIIPQFADKNNKIICAENFSKGIYAFVFGLSKKVLLADTLGNIVNVGFDSLSSLDATNAVIVMLGYTFQIYFDFSGYSDMAVGIGKMFNIEITQNFNSPYQALTISDFWKRWHMTLTRFFTTYVYIPLGGNRKGNLRTFCNMFVVFFLSGLWHGANWTFIIWGSLHGVATIINRMLQKQISKLHPALSWLLTFGFVNVMWVFFRAPSVGAAFLLLKQILTLRFGPIMPSIASAALLPEFSVLNSFLHINSSYYKNLLLVFFLVASLVICLGGENTYIKAQKLKPSFVSAVICAFLLTWDIISFSGVSTFLYFNF